VIHGLVRDGGVKSPRRYTVTVDDDNATSQTPRVAIGAARAGCLTQEIGRQLRLTMVSC
jgi:hypothetical protein